MSKSRILDEQIDGLTHVYRVAIDSAPVNEAVDRQLTEVGKTARIPGFRVGRAPLHILRNHYGTRIRDQVIDHMAIEVARGLIAEKALEPIRRPTINIDEPGSQSEDTVEFTLLLEVAPSFELGPLENFQLRRLVPSADQDSLDEQARSHLRRQLFDVLMARYDFPVPKDMVEHEHERIKHGFEAEVGEPVDPEMDRELVNIAERRIRLAILLTEIGRVHNIIIPPEEVEALVERQAQRDPAHQAELIDYYLDHPTALAELQSPLFEDRVVEFLLDRSEIEEINVTPEEFHRLLEQE